LRYRRRHHPKSGGIPIPPPDNSFFLLAWDPPKRFTVTRTVQTPYTAIVAGRCIWLAGQQYAHEVRPTFFIMVFERGTWRVSDIQAAEANFNADMSLLRDLSAPEWQQPQSLLKFRPWSWNKNVPSQPSDFSSPILHTFSLNSYTSGVMSAFPVKCAVLAATFSVILATAPSDAKKPDNALLVIWQQSGFPVPGREPAFRTGLVAAVWPDGRVIRATDKNQVGQAYVEGRARPKQFAEFLRFLTAPRILTIPDDFSVAVDSASRSITIRHAGKKHNWTYTLSDPGPLLNEIEARIWDLPLEGVVPVDPKKTDLHHLRDA
jgi:hypothetical protein